MSTIEQDIDVPVLRFDRYWTVDEWHRAGDEGYFAPDERVELFRGRVVAMTPMRGPHLSLTGRIVRLLNAAIPERTSLVFGQAAITLNDSTEPSPDIMIVAWRQDEYFGAIPQAGDAHLIMEISDSTRSYDLHEKAAEYARSGIHEYWVCDVKARRVVVHRGANRDGTWQSVESFSGRDSVSPLRFPDVVLTVDQLTGPPNPQSLS